MTSWFSLYFLWILSLLLYLVSIGWCTYLGFRNGITNRWSTGPHWRNLIYVTVCLNNRQCARIWEDRGLYDVQAWCYIGIIAIRIVRDIGMVLGSVLVSCQIHPVHTTYNWFCSGVSLQIICFWWPYPLAFVLPITVKWKGSLDTLLIELYQNQP